jgi:hypothetical protein
MGLSGLRRGSYRRRLRRKYRRLRSRHAAGWWQASAPSRAERGSSQWPFADGRATLERPGYRQPGLPTAGGRSRPERPGSRPPGRPEVPRSRPRRARRRQRPALSDLPVLVAVTAAVSAVVVIAVAAGAVGVNQWVAAGDAANTTTAASPAVRTAPPPAPESRRTSGARQPGVSARPVVVVSQLTAGREDAWPGLGSDWARPNPRRALLSAILNGIWSGILQAFLPDPYRSARRRAAWDRGS